jgi:hypothetical protein
MQAAGCVSGAGGEACKCKRRHANCVLAWQQSSAIVNAMQGCLSLPPVRRVRQSHVNRIGTT